MKKVKFNMLFLGDTFYSIGDYMKIEQYEKISESFGLEILTNTSKWFEEDTEVYID